MRGIGHFLKEEAKQRGEKMPVFTIGKVLEPLLSHDRFENHVTDIVDIIFGNPRAARKTKSSTEQVLADRLCLAVVRNVLIKRLPMHWLP